MSEARKFAAESVRVETGPIQFGDDWPGVFIRGDNALFYAVAVLAAAELLPDDAWALKSQLEGLASDLRSCSVGDTGWPPVGHKPRMDARSEMAMWLSLFEVRKHELIAGGMTIKDADEAACTEVRRRIRAEGFRE